MGENELSTPAGWYPDAEIPGGQRYWDGSQWTEHRTPPPAESAADPAPASPALPPPDVSTVVAAGDEPPKKGLGTGAKIGIGVAAVFGVLILLGAIGSAMGGGDKNEGASASSSSPSAPSNAGSPATSPTSASPTSASPTEDGTAAAKAAIIAAIGDNNRDGAPPPSVTITTGKAINVEWAAKDNLTEGLVKDSLRLDAVNVLKAVHENVKTPYTEVNLKATFSLVDKLGNTSEDMVFNAVIPKAIVDKINYDNFDFHNIDGLDENAFIHPAFRY